MGRTTIWCGRNNSKIFQKWTGTLSLPPPRPQDKEKKKREKYSSLKTFKCQQRPPNFFIMASLPRGHRGCTQPPLPHASIPPTFPLKWSQRHDSETIRITDTFEARKPINHDNCRMCYFRTSRKCKKLCAALHFSDEEIETCLKDCSK